MFDNVRSIKIVSDNLNYKEFNKTKNIWKIYENKLTP
jgi:hypothetical protein